MYNIIINVQYYVTYLSVMMMKITYDRFMNNAYDDIDYTIGGLIDYDYDISTRSYISVDDYVSSDDCDYMIR